MSTESRSLFLGYEAVNRFDGTQDRGERVQLDADALVRHAFVCGASGAGKTVFAKGMVEEAILAGIPVIAVDFKGDLASMALTGRLASREALKAVLEDEGDDAYEEFSDGLERARASGARAPAYARTVEPRLFTPDSSLGRRLALAALPSFPDPVDDPLEKEEQDKLTESLVRGFCLSMFGTNSKTLEPSVKVIEALVQWCNLRGERLEGVAGIARILHLVQEPPFEALGGLPLSAYLAGKPYRALLTGLNSRIVGVERNRYEGPRMSVETLIGDPAPGRVPLTIVYLGHLTDFNDQSQILGQICAEVYRWMRRQGGSRRARLLLYVDELGGGDNKYAFYPSAPYNPPSKGPLTLLVKQGRSAGVGVVLATQNPMSVDIRGLANVNTWAIGRLTQKNDQGRIKDIVDSMPGGAQRVLSEVARMPTGAFLMKSDALPSAKIVWERWLYSVHRQLTSWQVRTIHQLLTDGRVERSEAHTDPPPVKLEPPRAVPQDRDQRAQVEIIETRTLAEPGPPDPREAETRTYAAPSPIKWELRHSEQRWVVGPMGIKVGRSSGADAQLDDPHVSRLHVELVQDGEDLLVRALQTKNPTFVDDRVLDVEARLPEGMHTLKVGSLVMTLIGRVAGPVRLA